MKGKFRSATTGKKVRTKIATPDSADWVPNAHRHTNKDRYRSARVEHSDTKE